LIYQVDAHRPHREAYDEENIVEVEIYKWGSKERVGVALSGKNRWPRVVNISDNGLARGRMRVNDLIMSINGTEVFQEEVANRILRETVGRISIRIFRRNMPNFRDDLTEVAISFSSRDVDEPSRDVGREDEGDDADDIVLDDSDEGDAQEEEEEETGSSPAPSNHSRS